MLLYVSGPCERTSPWDIPLEAMLSSMVLSHVSLCYNSVGRVCLVDVNASLLPISRPKVSIVAEKDAKKTHRSKSWHIRVRKHLRVGPQRGYILLQTIIKASLYRTGNSASWSINLATLTPEDGVIVVNLSQTLTKFLCPMSFC